MMVGDIAVDGESRLWLAEARSSTHEGGTRSHPVGQGLPFR
jgi:hypothetical protein